MKSSLGIKLFVMNSGDEVIAEAVELKDGYRISYPMVLKPVETNGSAKYKIGFFSWCKYTSQNIIDVSKSSVTTVVDPHIEIVIEYKSIVQKLVEKSYNVNMEDVVRDMETSRYQPLTPEEGSLGTRDPSKSEILKVLKFLENQGFPIQESIIEEKPYVPDDEYMCEENKDKALFDVSDDDADGDYFDDDEFDPYSRWLDGDEN